MPFAARRSRDAMPLRTAQSAWVRYRDAYIDATFPLENKQQEYGTMYSMRVSGIRADMAREQIRHIKILCEDSAKILRNPLTSVRATEKRMDLVVAGA